MRSCWPWHRRDQLAGVAPAVVEAAVLAVAPTVMSSRWHRRDQLAGAAQAVLEAVVLAVAPT